MRLFRAYDGKAPALSYKLAFKLIFCGCKARMVVLPTLLSALPISSILLSRNAATGRKKYKGSPQ